MRPSVHAAERCAYGLRDGIERPEFHVGGPVAELAERDLKIGYLTVWNFLPAEEPSFKKAVVASERDRPTSPAGEHSR